MTRRVLFLCSGNYYRSRYAEILFNHLASQTDSPWRADSCGLRLSPGNVGPMMQCAIDRLVAKGISVKASERFPIQLAKGDLKLADRVIAMKAAEHRPLLRQSFPGWVDMVEFWEIDDVDVATPDEALTALDWEISNLIRRLPAREPELVGGALAPGDSTGGGGVP